MAHRLDCRLRFRQTRYAAIYRHWTNVFTNLILIETITIQIFKDDVYEEVAKATDYTGAKLIDGDEKARDRILATDSELSDLGRFWEEAVLATNERLKEMLISGATKQVAVPLQLKTTENAEPEERTMPPHRPPMSILKTAYVANLEVSKSFDRS